MYIVSIKVKSSHGILNMVSNTIYVSSEKRAKKIALKEFPIGKDKIISVKALEVN